MMEIQMDTKQGREYLFSGDLPITTQELADYAMDLEKSNETRMAGVYGTLSAQLAMIQQAGEFTSTNLPKGMGLGEVIRAFPCQSKTTEQRNAIAVLGSLVYGIPVFTDGEPAPETNKIFVYLDLND